MAGKIGFIGAGRMAGAMIDGLIAKGVYSKDEIVACAPTEETRKRMCQRAGIAMYSDASEIAPLCDVLVYAAKPKNVPEVFGSLKASGKLVVSIAAGVKLKTYMSYVPDARFVRVMPNHCCMVLEGASGYVMGDGCTAQDEETVVRILSATGLCVKVREEDLDAVTGVSGSSPAFLYMALRGLVEAGKKYGLTEEQALRLAAQSMVGAGRMALESGMTLDALIDGVCSPGGTTIEGVKSLEKDGFEEAMVRAVDATVARSIEMGKQREPRAREGPRKTPSPLAPEQVLHKTQRDAGGVAPYGA